jgi:selenocysteine lyase/cysteine desulfurase
MTSSSTKRNFLKTIFLGGLATLPAYRALARQVERVAHLSPGELAPKDDFWQEIRGHYRLKPDYINLENGYYNILPTPTLEAYLDHVREVNYQGSYYMRTVQFENKRNLAARLAELVDCSSEELVITRNTTESLDLIIAGYPWEAGDEAVMCDQDYGAMLNMFEQVASRYGVVNKVVELPNHPASDEEIVQLYEQAITPKTKLLMVCHMINITGQVLPVRKICDMAHRHGVEVMVDGAHTVAHIPVSMQELNCDYFGSSLHKWLSAPMGSGILFVKKDKIKKLWPLFAESPLPENDIYRLNHTGTSPVHVDLGIANALEFYQHIGAERKEARLRFLQEYWTKQVRSLPHIILNTPADPQRACAIANVGVKGIAPGDLAKRLMDEHRIWTVAINHPNVQGVRITPNVFTTTEELDTFVAALKSIQP